MLRMAAKSNKIEAEAEFMPDSHPAPGRIGDELKHAARRLHDALGRMEEAVHGLKERLPTATVGGGSAEELRAENHRLREAERRAQQELDEAQRQNQAVSGQVNALSARLEALIARLSKLLEESA